jgi:hypothetical protein
MLASQSLRRRRAPPWQRRLWRPGREARLRRAGGGIRPSLPNQQLTEQPTAPRKPTRRRYPLSRMPCLGPTCFLFDGVCFLAAGLGLTLGSDTTLLGTGEVEVGAYNVEETGGRAPTGRARLQSAPPRTQTRGDERRGAWSGPRGEDTIRGKPRRNTVRGGWWARRVLRVGRYGVGDKNITFLAEMLSKLRFLSSFHLFGRHAILRVGPT